MLEMDKFFRKRDEISIPKERGDRLRISEKDGTPYNLERENGTYKLKNAAVERIIKFIKIMADFTKWDFKEANWLWNNFDLFKFTKGDFQGAKLRINGNNYKEMMDKNPLSWAMTSGQNIEYTLEEPGKLP